ncbi:MAG: hypothetical protein Kow0056_16710 [Coriobacteriia bacterium]
MVVSFVATAAVLALVILGVAALSEPRRASSDSSAALAEQSSQLYESALSKLESGETTEAIGLLRQAVMLNPANEDAAAKLDELETVTINQGGGAAEGGGSQSSDSGEGDGSSSSEPPSSDSVGPASLLPGSIEGFVTVGDVVEGLDVAQRIYEPTPESQYYFHIVRALLIVHDKRDASGAEGYVESSSQRLFPFESQVLDVDGDAGYFGTDGGTGATAVVPRGRYVFEVILSANAYPPSELSEVGEYVLGFCPHPPE